MSEQATYGATGAAQGAQAGAVFGPIGMGVGAVIGGIAGAFAGSAARRGRILANRANKTQRMLQLMEAAVQRRDMIRQARMSRAETLAAGTSMGRGDAGSSAISGALSSTGSQLAFNTRYFDTRIQDYLLMQRWLDKAGKAAKNASDGMALIGLASSVAGAYGSSRGETPRQGTQTTTVSGGGTPVTIGGVSQTTRPWSVSTTAPIFPSGG